MDATSSTTPMPARPSTRAGLPRMQEAGLLVVIVLLGLGLTIFGGNVKIGNVAVKIKTLPEAPDKILPESFTDFFMHQWRPYVQPVPLIVTFICLLASWFYLTLMVAGRENYAVGGNEEAARFSGLKVGAI